jgi:hypothetical protein
MIDFRQYFIDKYYNRDWLTRAKEEYNNADPFPHIVIDNFLPDDVLNKVLGSFPKANELEWETFNNHNEMKLGSRHEIQLPQVARNVIADLNSGHVLDWLEMLTSVSGLIADTRLVGGGMHQILNGGKLGIHLDFNIERRTKLSRQLNLLLYLNKDWDDSYEGHLEMWDETKTKCIKTVAPIFNRCVIFNTTGKSWHGHPIPLNTPGGVTRKSIALYYYNVSTQEVVPHSTIF